jgi:hypothetical protein
MAAPAANLEGFRDWAVLDIVVLGICLLVGVIIAWLMASAEHRRLMDKAKGQPPKPKHQFIPRKKNLQAGAHDETQAGE